MKKLRIPLAIVLAVVAGRTFTADAQTVSETVLYSFFGSLNTDVHDGGGPFAGLVQSSDGNFYGTTVNGGTSTNCPGGCGTVFRISPSGTYTSLYSFGSSPTDGAHPDAGLVQGSDSNFYGTTVFGGTSTNHLCGLGCGTVFRISPSGSYTSLYSFAGWPNDGGNPDGGLVQGSDGNFYGTTAEGGTNNEPGGTVFRISPSGIETLLYSFDSVSDGLDPGGLVQGADGNFYGTTGEGGLFRVSPRGIETIISSFVSHSPNGYDPSVLVQGGDGNFYGTTSEGGTTAYCGYGCGTVFRVSPSGTYTSLYSFGSYPTDGTGPLAGLVQGSDGNFYGTTQYGGDTNYYGGGVGTLFRITPSGTYTSLYSFTGSPENYDGEYPVGGLIQGSDGNFYGTTENGGTSGAGTVFKLDVGLGHSSTNCLYSINSTNAAFAAAGGSDSVSVTASNGCAWTAASNDPSLITITSGSSGSGNGTVHYSVAANTNSSEQVGTMTIAGQTFTVTQSGASAAVATPTITPDGGDLADSVKVTLKCATPKAVIHYTIDGSEPTSGSPKYKSPITLTNSVTINAVAFVGTTGPSDTATASFTISTPSITTATDLPSGTVGDAYSGVTLQATGGTTPYKWSLAPKSKLPAGLKLGSTGTITGKPTKAGSATFTVKVTDAKKGTAEQSFAVTIN
jgi:uncharacterized repeat protein (TIGR03803 family)